MRLRRRILQLEEEKKMQRRQLKDSKARLILLQKHKRLFQVVYKRELERMTSKCDELMIQKFGKIDDMAVMELVMINPRLEELSTKMLVLQANMQKEQEKMEGK
ncbi:unnamed protein product [Protopolystoma xenopodis]|uniref:Uncharacterized protein n=1 Tax=Protopolystoma xenopodis TaxID=117903 RepID=A0A3S5BR08_9PLAT|nr:unnamed protein product [Protopolystoma xenopodis]